ncbi:glucoamylase family protein [Massilia sp. DWR3-1-1]|uniref:glucoamylase family protein n=1 Tax=Massilia sp. DWR3-1-1 TaxID=2804559 RepID=UPI003CE6F4A4
MPLDAGHDELLTSLQQESFAYFLVEANEANGLVRDKTAPDWPASIAAVGLALTIYPIGVERAMMSRTHARARTLATLRFFAGSRQGRGLKDSGYKGFYYHFLDMESGERAFNSELSSVDTALLMAGVLTAAAYFTGEDAAETEIRTLAEMLYRRVDWQWMRDAAPGNPPLLCHGWKPRSGFLPYHWKGYDEALILYILALGSPTYPIDPASYEAWLTGYQWKTVYGIEYVYAGPLFIHQLSHVWIDFRGIQDSFMAARGIDYFENSRRATHVQQRYAIHNPYHFERYGQWSWGVTASDGPGPVKKTIAGEQRVFYDYIARGVPYGPDDGTLAPWAVVASLPFAPEIVIPTIEAFCKLKLRAVNPYGFKASFSATFQHDEADSDIGWVSAYHFGINEGPTVVMIDNHRSDFIWGLMRGCAHVQSGLRRAGFKGGWLAGL